MKKIRILHVAQAAGGVDRYLQMLLKYLDKNKFENILVCSQDYNKRDYEKLVIAFEQCHMRREIGLTDIKNIGYVRKLIKKYEPDIVYAHSSKAGAVTRIADIGLKNHCIYNPHGWAFNMKIPKEKQKLYATIERFAAQFCERIICISDAEKKSALDQKICKKDKLQVIYNGVDIIKYESESHGTLKRSNLDIPESAFVVGMVGRISRQKAPDIFIRAARMIKQDIPNAHFIIVGSGEMEDDIRDFADKNGLMDCLHITGWVQNSIPYIEMFDVACLLSRWEGFGLVLPEYMMVGKPIVATRVDAIPDIIQDGVNGILVSDNCIDAVYEAVMKIYKNCLLRDRFISNSVMIVKKRFNVLRMVRESEDLFGKLVRNEQND